MTDTNQWVMKQPPDPAKIKRLIDTSIKRVKSMPGVAENVRLNSHSDTRGIKEIRNITNLIIKDLQEAMQEADKIARNPKLVR